MPLFCGQVAILTRRRAPIPKRSHEVSINFKTKSSRGHSVP